MSKILRWFFALILAVSVLIALPLTGLVLCFIWLINIHDETIRRV